jgi:hypothetical protein
MTWLDRLPYVESRRRNLGNERDKLQGLQQLPTPLES